MKTEDTVHIDTLVRESFATLERDVDERGIAPKAEYRLRFRYRECTLVKRNFDLFPLVAAAVFSLMILPPIVWPDKPRLADLALTSYESGRMNGCSEVFILVMTQGKEYP